MYKLSYTYKYIQLSNRALFVYILYVYISLYIYIYIYIYNIITCIIGPGRLRKLMSVGVTPNLPRYKKY